MIASLSKIAGKPACRGAEGSQRRSAAEPRFRHRSARPLIGRHGPPRLEIRPEGRSR